MTTIAPPAPRSSSRTRNILLAFIGAPILALLGFFWLEIPDSHVWQLAFSLVSGAILAIAFLWLASALVRAIRNTTFSCSHVLGALLVFVWLTLQWLLVRFVLRIDNNAMLRAGYWNSQLSAHMRNTFTFDRLIAWQHDLVLLLVWIIIPALLTPFFIETVARGLGGNVWSVAVAIFRRWQHWLAIIICDVAVYWLTGKLTGWRPSHSVHGELVSLAFRLCLCYVADFLLVCLLLAVDSPLLAREHARRYTTAEPSANVA